MYAVFKEQSAMFSLNVSLNACVFKLLLKKVSLGFFLPERKSIILLCLAPFLFQLCDFVVSLTRNGAFPE